MSSAQSTLRLTRLHPLILHLPLTCSVFLVTVHDPVCTDSGDPSNALYGSFLPIPSDELFPLESDELYSAANAAGAVVCRGDAIKINKGRRRVKIRVTNTGDRPVQVSSALGISRDSPTEEQRTRAELTIPFSPA